MEFLMGDFPEGSQFAGEKVLVPDADEDGNWDADDLKELGLQPGSLEAKKAWLAIEAKSLTDGQYNGSPLRDGSHPGDGDFSFLEDKLVWYNGYSSEVAKKIAGKIAAGK